MPTLGKPNTHTLEPKPIRSIYTIPPVPNRHPHLQDPNFLTSNPNHTTYP